MRVALLTTFAASRKEPLIEMMNRVHQAFLDSGFGEPMIRFNFGDAPLAGFVSSVDRVLKRHPQLARFVTSADPMPGIQGARRISNGPVSPGAGETVPYETLQAIAAGVPRSFPFHSVMLHFYTERFGVFGEASTQTAELLPGILLSDSWWVNGRQRSLSACTVVEADPSSKKLPPLPEAVAAVFAACGKVKKTIQAPLPGEAERAQAIPVRLPGGLLAASANPEAAQAVRPIVVDYRARMKEIMERAALPHDLPPQGGAPLGATSGPRKPVLAGTFKPMGYSCKGESGTFSLRRRTAANLTLELSIDAGTWSHAMMAIFKVSGLGFKATLVLPPTLRGTAGAQYPIGDAEQWQKLVENLAALVKELERTFVPDIERAAGPSPEWYSPES
jgi:hypothetical protein